MTFWTYCLFSFSNAVLLLLFFPVSPCSSECMHYWNPASRLGLLIVGSPVHFLTCCDFLGKYVAFMSDRQFCRDWNLWGRVAATNFEEWIPLEITFSFTGPLHLDLSQSQRSSQTICFIHSSTHSLTSRSGAKEYPRKFAGTASKLVEQQWSTSQLKLNSRLLSGPLVSLESWAHWGLSSESSRCIGHIRISDQLSIIAFWEPCHFLTCFSPLHGRSVERQVLHTKV